MFQEAVLCASESAPGHVSGKHFLCFRRCTRCRVSGNHFLWFRMSTWMYSRKEECVPHVFWETLPCLSGCAPVLCFWKSRCPQTLSSCDTSQEERVCGPVLCFRKAGRLHQNVAEESIPCTSGHAPGSVSGDHSCVSGCISRQPNVYSWMCTRTCLRKAAPAPFAGRMMRPVRSRERHAGRLMFMRC